YARSRIPPNLPAPNTASFLSERLRVMWESLFPTLGVASRRREKNAIYVGFGQDRLSSVLNTESPCAFVPPVPWRPPFQCIRWLRVFCILCRPCRRSQTRSFSRLPLPDHAAASRDCLRRSQSCSSSSERGWALCESPFRPPAVSSRSPARRAHHRK